MSAEKVPIRRRRGKAKTKQAGPKRPVSAYLFFAKEMRPLLKESNPDLTFTEVGTEIGIKWGKLSPSERHKYEQLAMIDRHRWETEKASFIASSISLPPRERLSKKKPSGFQYFSQNKIRDLAEADPSLSHECLESEARRLWSTLTSEEQEGYLEMAKASSRPDGGRFA